MCTAISDNHIHHLFGRTLDLEKSYGEKVVITPRNFNVRFIHEKNSASGHAIIGTAHAYKNFPLYYDAINECGLGIAALNFPSNAQYFSPKSKVCNIAAFELILWILRQCDCVKSAEKILKSANITNDYFANELPSTPLHWLIADKSSAITVESGKGGLKIYQNPFGILTNSPPFPYHMTNILNYLHISSSTPHNLLCPNISLTPYSRGMGGLGLPGDFSSSSRFVKAVFAKNKTLHEDDVLKEISRFFHIMDTVSQPRGCVEAEDGRPVSTVYTSCADTDSGIYYYTTYYCRKIRAVDMHDYDVNGPDLIGVEMSVREDIE